jgi:hypothetical protein
MTKKWLFKTTPFLILSILIVLAILYQAIIEKEHPEGLGYLAIHAALPFAFAMLIIDVTLKLVIKKSIKIIWVIEGLLSLVLLYCWIIT